MNAGIAIHKALHDALYGETYPGCLFDGFKVYEHYPDDDVLISPCIAMVMVPKGVVKTYHGGATIRGIDISLELMFRTRDIFDMEGGEYSGEELCQLYDIRLNDAVEGLDLSAHRIYYKEKTTDFVSPAENNMDWYGVRKILSIGYKE